MAPCQIDGVDYWAWFSLKQKCHRHCAASVNLITVWLLLLKIPNMVSIQWCFFDLVCLIGYSVTHCHSPAAVKTESGVKSPKMWVVFFWEKEKAVWKVLFFFCFFFIKLGLLLQLKFWHHNNLDGCFGFFWLSVHWIFLIEYLEAG